MRKTPKVAIIALSLAMSLGLVGVTRSWFVDLNELPPGSVNVGLVRYLPEGNRDIPAVLTYGNLVSGRNVDRDGIPHILPGESLQSKSGVIVTDGKGVQIVDTTMARAFETGETEGTVITRDAKAFGTDQVTRTQRDILTRSHPTETWTPSAPTTTLDPQDYRIVTTADTKTQEAHDKTVTTTTTATTYTPLVGITGTVYTYTIVREVTVTHEAATFSNPAMTETRWSGPEGILLRTVKETVLFPGTVAAPAKPTRISVHIELPTTAAAAPVAPLPLSLGNLSTVPTQVRVGVTVQMTEQGRPPVMLEAKKGADGKYYIGRTNTASPNNFIELLVLQMAAGSYDGGTYQWTPVTEPGSKSWTLWDLTLTPAGTPATSTTVIPPVAAVMPPGSAVPVKYTAVNALSVAKESAFGVVQKEFEKQFNELYCTQTPAFEVKIHYYAKQEQYMDWTEFHVEQIKMTLSQ